MAIRRHWPAYRQLDQLVMEGRAQLVGVPTVDTGTTPAVVATQAGQVAIITKIVGACVASNDTSPGLSDAGVSQGLFLYDENGDQTNEGVRFLAFQKVDAVMGFSPSAGEDSWKSAPPNRPVVWEPEEPLIVPPNHTLRAVMDSVNTMAGGSFACYGYIVDQGTARMLGFSTNTQDATYKQASPGGSLNMAGFRGVVISATGVTEVIQPFSGMTVQIIDIYVRVQPMSAGSTTRTLLLGSATDATDAAIGMSTLFVACNNNHGDMAEFVCAPGVYLDPNEGFYIGTANDCRASVSVTYRYVPNSEVPRGQWWAYAAITPPALTSQFGTSSLFTTGTAALSLRFQAIDGSGFSPQVIVSPDTGAQHVVEGYCISGQKDATVPGDRLYFALTEGSTGGSLGISGSGATTTNNLISPILCLGGHNQMLALAVDGLNIPCTRDQGAIRIDMVGAGSGSSTPIASDNDVDELHVLVWGRTIPSRFGDSHFQGAAS